MLRWPSAAPIVRSGAASTRCASSGRQQLPGLQGVQHVVGVASCKGGVGKSTVAVNLAHSFLKQGRSVGVLDADVYGPSLPTMVDTGKDPANVTQSNSLLDPVLSSDGVKCMSFGFLNPKAAVLRGPMLLRAVTALLQTNWGQLDVLVVDLPPGTGDVHLTLGQQMSMAGAVMVTTPQRLSLVDVVKGIETFTALKIPTLAVVENMAHFTCEHGTTYKLFGDGHASSLVAQYGIPHAFGMPLEPSVSAGGDSGAPVVMSHPDSSTAELYTQLASAVMTELDNASSGAADTVSVQWDSRRAVLSLRTMGASGATEAALPPAYVRARCQCATCVDEVSGVRTFSDCDVDPTVQPVAVNPLGNYAVGIHWSDGHTTSIYPYSQLQAMAKELGV